MTETASSPMYSLITQRLFQGFIDEPMLLDQSLAFKSRRYDDQLPMVAATGQILGLANRYR